MKEELEKRIEDYVRQPFGLLEVGCIRIGRHEFKDIRVQGRESAIQLQEMLNSASDRSRRNRLRKDGTRYYSEMPIGAPARLLSSEIDDYLQYMEHRGLRSRTIDANARSLALLMIVTGDIPVSRIDTKHIHKFWQLMQCAPPSLATTPRLQQLSADELIELGRQMGAPVPARATLELHRRFLATFFNGLVKAQAIPHSPLSAFPSIKKDLIEETHRSERLLGDDDLQKIFNPDSFLPWAMKFPHRWWCPMIGLYTGARINEVAQLKVADIVQEQGMWCIAFRKTIDADLANASGARSRQSLKGKSAVRTIPIAEPLLAAGLLDYVADIKSTGHPRLFPNLSAGISRKTGETNARYSQALLIQYGTYLKQLGFPKGVGFHAFRHTLATALDNLGVRTEDVALITGHSVVKTAPVLQASYYHTKPDCVRARQKAALDLYKPPVELPTYTRGQFRDRIGWGAKLYP